MFEFAVDGFLDFGLDGTGTNLHTIVSCFAMSDWSAGFWARSGVCFFTILPKVLLILQLLIPYNSASNLRGRNNYRIAAYVIFALNRRPFKNCYKIVCIARPYSYARVGGATSSYACISFASLVTPRTGSPCKPSNPAW